MPTSPTEVSAHIEYATTKEQLAKIFIEEEEKEHILISAPVEEEEHALKMLTPWEKELEMLEDWLNNPELEYGC
jgi:hypothetical protein